MVKRTIKDIAREAGVSTATVSRVLNNSGYVSEQVRKRVLDVIEQFNYQPNAFARSLKQDKSRSIGIVLPDLANPHFMKMARAIQHRCFREGYHLLFMDTEENPQKEKEALKFLVEQRIEVLILAGTGGNLDLLQSIKHSGIPVILADRRLSGLQADVVTEDNLNAAKCAMNYLTRKGHGRIGILSGPQTISTARERREGALNGLEEAGAALDACLLYEGDYTRTSGMEAIRYFMQAAERPTALFSANNEMTFGVYLGLREMGLPLDSIEVVSFGDLEFSSLFRHKLAVIVQNPEGIGKIAGDLMIRRIQQPGSDFEHRILAPELVPLDT